MQTAKARDAMVKRAVATLEKFQTLRDLPEIDEKGGKKATLRERVENDSAYHEAVYKVSAEGEVIGRQGSTILGTAIKGD